MNPANNNFDKKATIFTEVEKKVKDILSEQLGTEPEDIGNDDSFSDNLNMRTSEISDLFCKIEESSNDEKKIDTEEVQTVGDLIEYLSAEESL
jgi:acyl carrier protein